MVNKENESMGQEEWFKDAKPEMGRKKEQLYSKLKTDHTLNGLK